MEHKSSSLGTALRHLIELLDGAVEAGYDRFGLKWRARYTPVLRALLTLGPASIRDLSRQGGLSHSALSQTIAQMTREGLVESRPGRDARERIVALTVTAEAMIPALRRQWAMVDAAAAGLDAELSAPLSRIVDEALAALQRHPYEDRIAEAAQILSQDSRAPVP